MTAGFETYDEQGTKRMAPSRSNVRIIDKFAVAFGYEPQTVYGNPVNIQDTSTYKRGMEDFKKLITEHGGTWDPEEEKHFDKIAREGSIGYNQYRAGFIAIDPTPGAHLWVQPVGTDLYASALDNGIAYWWDCPWSWMLALNNMFDHTPGGPEVPTWAVYNGSMSLEYWFMPPDGWTKNRFWSEDTVDVEDKYVRGAGFLIVGEY
jgi:hypothetical protein